MSSSAGAVLVTGADSGLGQACALRLAAAGHHVIAGVLADAHGDALSARAPGRVTPVRLDVTDEAEIARAARTIAEATRGAGLAGLVNNAGIGVTGPAELLPVAEFRRQFEVNYFGQIAVTQAMLPMLRSARGRIVNVGSIGDRITLPFGAALCGSKYALASYNDALRIELRPWGIRVILVEPGAMATPAVDAVEHEARERLADLGPAGRHLYGDAYAAMARAFTQDSREEGSPPDVVARVIERALTTERPRTRYLAGAKARPMAVLAGLAPDRLLDRLRLRLLEQPRGFGDRAGEPAGGSVRDADAEMIAHR